MSRKTSHRQQVVVMVVAATVAAQVAAMAAVVVTPVAAIAVVMTVALLATALAVIAVLAVAIRVVTAAETPVASARLIAHRVHIPQLQSLTQRRAHLIVRLLIVRVMAKIARLHTSIVTPHRVVISQIAASVANARLHRVKIAHRLVTVLIVLRSRIAANVPMVVLAQSVAAGVIVIRVQPGAAMIVPRHVANILTQRLRNVVNSRRVLSVVIVLSMTSCRFSAQRA